MMVLFTFDTSSVEKAISQFFVFKLKFANKLLLNRQSQLVLQIKLFKNLIIMT